MKKNIDILSDQIKSVSTELAEMLALGYQIELSTSKNGNIKAYKMKKKHHVLNFKELHQNKMEV